MLLLPGVGDVDDFAGLPFLHPVLQRGEVGCRVQESAVGFLNDERILMALHEDAHRPVAFLRTADGSLPDPAAIDGFLRRTLPGFKMPQRYLAWPDIEEGTKPDRRSIAALAQTTQ